MKIGTTDVNFEFDHAICRPCPKNGRCVGLTGKGDVASVTGLSAANGGEITKQVINGVDPTFTKYGQVNYVDAPLKGFDMGYIKMQAIGPGQCVVKAELSYYAEVGAHNSIFYRVEDPGRRPKIPVAANKLVNLPATPRFEVLGVIAGREILKKSKKCKNWWKKKVKNARKLKKKCTAK